MSMQDISNFDKIKKGKNESENAYRLKVLLANLASTLVFKWIVKRRATEVRGEHEKDKKLESIRNRFEKALLEFRKLHGPNNVIIVSFSGIERLCKLYDLE